MKLMTKFGAYFDRTTNILATLTCVLIIFIMLSATAEVISRKLLGGSIKGVIEINEACLVYLTFLGATWLLRREGHVKMDLVVNRLGHATQALTNMITSMLGAIFCLVVAWYGMGTTWDMFQRGIHRTTVLEAPVAPLIVIIPIGSLLLSIQFIRRAYGYLGEWKTSSTRTTEGGTLWNGH